MRASVPSSSAAPLWSDGNAYRRALVVGNPVAGRGKGAAVAQEVAEGLKRQGVATELFLTQKRGDARARLRTEAEGVDFVVSVGGDGTLSEVFSGLMDPETPVGVVPMGTANCLGIALGIPRDVHRALEIFRTGRIQPIDVALVNDQVSFLVTGVGFDGMAVREVERRRRGPITKAAYVTAVLRSLARYQPPRLAVELDGRTLNAQYGLVLVANTQNYGGFLHLSPETRIDDGQFEVYLFPSGSRWELFRGAVQGVLRHLPGGPVEMHRARRVAVSSEDPVPFQVDGDYRGETPIELEVSPTQYHLLVP